MVVGPVRHVQFHVRQRILGTVPSAYFEHAYHFDLSSVLFLPAKRTFEVFDKTFLQLYYRLTPFFYFPQVPWFHLQQGMIDTRYTSESQQAIEKANARAAKERSKSCPKTAFKVTESTYNDVEGGLSKLGYEASRMNQHTYADGFDVDAPSNLPIDTNLAGRKSFQLTMTDYRKQMNAVRM